jgi:hypothetical protein
MTADEESTFVTLWQQGATYAELAAALHVPLGTISSRAAALQRAGKIAKRPRGGAFPHQQAQGHPPVHPAAQRSAEPPPGHGADPVQDGADPPPLHGAVQVQSSAELPIPAALATELTRLWAAIDALRQDMHRPVHPTVQSLPEPLFDDPEDNATERWNLYLKHGLRVRIEALAQARGVAPSRVVQELLWHALHCPEGPLDPV